MCVRACGGGEVGRGGGGGQLNVLPVPVALACPTFSRLRHLLRYRQKESRGSGKDNIYGISRLPARIAPTLLSTYHPAS